MRPGEVFGGYDVVGSGPQNQRRTLSPQNGFRGTRSMGGRSVCLLFNAKPLPFVCENSGRESFQSDETYRRAVHATIQSAA